MALRGLASFENGSIGDKSYIDDSDSGNTWSNTASISAGIVAGGKFNNGYEFVDAELLDWFDNMTGLTEVYVTFWVNIPDDGSTGGSIITVGGYSVLRLSSSNAYLTLFDNDGLEVNVAGTTTYPRGVLVFNRVRVWGDSTNDLSCTWEWNDGTTSETVTNSNVRSVSGVSDGVIVNANDSAPGGGYTGFDATFDDIAVWSDSSGVPDVSPLPTTPVELPELVLSGTVAIGGSASVYTNDTVMSGSIAISGVLVGEVTDNAISGAIAFGGSVHTIFQNNSVIGSIAFGGTLDGASGVGATIGGSIAIGGEMEGVRINEDVTIQGIIAFSGVVLVGGTGSCVIPSYNSDRWC